ncbi:MAG: hypothetical protein LBD06_10325, partial [Candidatus Accumulibacter sp.]|nr:hypothetical protein [Accumulibacter sp.]
MRRQKTDEFAALSRRQRRGNRVRSRGQRLERTEDRETEHVPEDRAWRRQKTEKPSARVFLPRPARSAANS